MEFLGSQPGFEVGAFDEGSHPVDIPFQPLALPLFGRPAQNIRHKFATINGQCKPDFGIAHRQGRSSQHLRCLMEAQRSVRTMGLQSLHSRTSITIDIDAFKQGKSR
ncbi:MAG: hypothetical protein HT580_15315 [Dechloromonas sp.]|nr:MAG: hypothetical protein HT580_15315 [Dechloromonas sp.]